MRLARCVLTIAAMWPVAGHAEPYRQPSRYMIAGPPTEAIGCYWKNQRVWCSRYCYWEINGQRYCHEREREAHSQAPPGEYVYQRLK